MQFNQIKELIELCSEKQIYDLEIEEKGSKVRIQALAPPPKIRYTTAAPIGAVSSIEPSAAVGSLPETSAVEIPAIRAEAMEKVAETEAVDAKVEDAANFLTIDSPMVGTFYLAPAPGADQFVNAGDLVKPGSVLCIVEAMKLMNEIKSEVAGRVVKILVENAQPVEYGQPLFYIDPAG